MIDVKTLDEFLADTRGQALREGTRYQQEGRVESLEGDGEDFSSWVGGGNGEYEVCLGAEGSALHFGCSCPSWRSPCKHVVATVLSVREVLAIREQQQKVEHERKFDDALERALEERRHSAAAEKFELRFVDAPLVEVKSASGFRYHVRLRGGPHGPHSCDCPDFEANRLHTCKHVERVRAWLGKRRRPLPEAHAKLSARAHVYLYFGERIEPRLFGAPRGKGAAELRALFDDEGCARRRPKAEDASLLRFMQKLGARADAADLAWLEARVARRPKLPRKPFAALLPALPLTPYDYQWVGAEFLARRGRALLADEMGLGKTVQAILAAVAMRHAKEPVEHVTIVCPASLRGGWQDEIRRWVGEEATLLEGRADKRRERIATRPRWLITHYEQVLRDHEAHAAHAPDLLILDEAQRAKNFRARTSRVLKAIEPRHVFALTGTPLENRIEEAYAIAQLIDQRLLPPLWQLDRDHFVRDGDGRRVVEYRGLDGLRAQLSPAFLRRRKEDVALELPERVRSIATLPMHAMVQDTYEEMMSQVASIARRKVIRPRDLERMQRLLVIARRCCDGPHMFGHDVEDADVPKLAELQSLLRELALGEGRKVVVFSEWTDMTQRAEVMIRAMGLPVFHLSGRLPVKKRPKLIRDFERCEGPAVFLSTDAGGVGLNLQVADVVINLDLPWNPAKLEQRIARVHRIGSGSAVREVNMVCGGSIEERILFLHGVKQNVLDNIWSADGDDRILAPGGSGAFRKILAELLEEEQAAKAAAPTTSSPDVEETEVQEAQVQEAGAAPEAPPGPEAVDLPTGEADAASPVSADVAAAPPATASAAASSEPAPASPAAAPHAPGTLALDPAALAAAIGAVAPTLPAEHRASLSKVFRALAEALDV